ncbi:MAG: proprotein convertase P-domain-containing protein, partial [Actinomycetota bacterium]
MVAAAILIGGLSAEPAFGNPGLVRFAKALSTTIPATGTGPGPASVYPSSITYDWCPGAIADLDVDISAFGHTSPDDVDIVLQGPTGQSTMLMSDAGGGTDVEDLTLGFDDEAVSDLPDSTALSTGQFEPTDFGTVDAMPAPAPDPTTAALSVFDGTNPVGTWSLFVADDAAVDTGDIEFNWRIDMLVTSQAAGTEICVPNAGVGEPYPSEQTISGRTSSVQDLNVSLHGLRHRFNTDGLDVLLQGPAGQTTVLMSDAGGSDGLSNVTLTFDDEAAASLPDEAQISSGSFKPANFEGSDAFPFPAPGAPHGDTLDAFDGSDPNGTWKLFI